MTRDGRLTARQGRIYFDTGAFAGSGPGVASVATLVLAGPYRTPNLFLEGYAVYTNKTNCGSYRAPSGPQANFAVESQMDIIADALGIDPLELRLRNIVREGDEGPTGQVLTAVGLEECLLRAADAIGWKDRRPGARPRQGPRLRLVDDDGRLVGRLRQDQPRRHRGAQYGRGGDRHGRAHGRGPGPRRGARGRPDGYQRGLRRHLLDAVRLRRAGQPHGLRGRQCVPGRGGRPQGSVLFAQAAPQLGAIRRRARAARQARRRPPRGACRSPTSPATRRWPGGGLIAHGTFIAPGTAYDTKRVEGHAYPAFHSPSFHAHAVDLSVDEETGEVTIHKYVVAQDVGFALNPTYIEGQIEGGVAQGLGQTLSEEIVYREGRVLNANLTDYKMPTALDVPRVESIIVQHPGLIGPYGAKGVGEPPNVEPPATVANAIAAAIGVRITSLPITAEKIVLAPREGAR